MDAKIKISVSSGVGDPAGPAGPHPRQPGLLGIVLGVVRDDDHGRTSATVLPPMVIGALLVAAFVAWEVRAPEPMLPLYLFRSRSFTYPCAPTPRVALVTGSSRQGR
jgi:hypothetical protein